MVGLVAGVGVGAPRLGPTSPSGTDVDAYRAELRRLLLQAIDDLPLTLQEIVARSVCNSGMCASRIHRWGRCLADPSTSRLAYRPPLFSARNSCRISSSNVRRPTVRGSHGGGEGIVRVGEPLWPGLVEVPQRAPLERLPRVLGAGNRRLGVAGN